MKLYLSGQWTLKALGSSKIYNGQIPCCNYLDLINAGEIANPFVGILAKSTEEIADNDFECFRTFLVTAEQLSADFCDFIATGIDTLADIMINGSLILNANNAFRTWRIPVESILKKSKNDILVIFHSPTKYVARYVIAYIDGLDSESDDGFFDLVPGNPKTITFTNCKLTHEEVKNSILIKSFADIDFKGN